MSDLIAEKIAEALRSRARLRPFVTELVERWESLRRHVDELITAATRARSEAAGLQPPRPIGRDIEDVLGRPSLREEALRQLRDDLAELLAGLRTVEARFNRETVNIGVIGEMNAGKSTFLRQIANLPSEVLPTWGLLATTASRSAIYHDPHRREAVVFLRTWKEFRRDYLLPYHKELFLTDPPTQSDDFSKYKYPTWSEYKKYASEHPDASDKPSLQESLNRLREASESFDSYRDLLTGDKSKKVVELDELAQYVAYPNPSASANAPSPAKDSVEKRLYLAVSHVDIFCDFGENAVTGLALNDMPGMGEHGLHLSRHFLHGLVDQVDVLLQVKRPRVQAGGFTEVDFQAQDHVHATRGVLPLRDFLLVVLNRDRAHLTDEQFDVALREVAKATSGTEVATLVGDVIDSTAVHEEIILPVLSHLASRLASMDQRVLDDILRRLGRPLEDTRDLGDLLVGEVARWRPQLPRRESLIHHAAKRTAENISRDLERLRDVYLSDVSEGRRDGDLDAAVAGATDQVRKWIDGGLGAGSKERWVEEVRPAIARDEPGEVKRRADVARREVARAFGHVERSLGDAIAQQRDEVASIFRKHLHPDLVPDTADALEKLLEAARKDGLAAMIGVLEDYLPGLSDPSGRSPHRQLYLTTCHPIIRRIHWHDVFTEIYADLPSPVRTSVANPTADIIETIATEVLENFTPVPSTAAQPAVHELRVRLEILLRRLRENPAALPTEIAAIPSAGLRGDELVERAYSALTTSVEKALEDLGRRLGEESRRVVVLLFAAIDAFFDSFAGIPEIVEELVELCTPMADSVWPEISDHRLASLAQRLSELTESAQGLVAGADAISLTAL